jgi:hypothetical protein
LYNPPRDDFGTMIVIFKLNLKGVNMKKTYKTKNKRQQKDDVVFLLVSNWENVDDYSEEEIEDLLEENHIPEISYIDVIEKPDNIVFD